MARRYLWHRHSERVKKLAVMLSLSADGRSIGIDVLGSGKPIRASSTSGNGEDVPLFV